MFNMSKLYDFLDKNGFFPSKDFGSFYKKNCGQKIYNGKRLDVLKYLSLNQTFVEDCCLKQALFGDGQYFDEMCTTCSFAAFVLLKEYFKGLK